MITTVEWLSELEQWDIVYTMYWYLVYDSFRYRDKWVWEISFLCYDNDLEYQYYMLYEKNIKVFKVDKEFINNNIWNKKVIWEYERFISKLEDNINADIRIKNKIKDNINLLKN